MNKRTYYWVTCRRKSDNYKYLCRATAADLFFLDIDPDIEILAMERIK